MRAGCRDRCNPAGHRAAGRWRRLHRAPTESPPPSRTASRRCAWEREHEPQFALADWVGDRVSELAWGEPGSRGALRSCASPHLRLREPPRPMPASPPHARVRAARCRIRRIPPDARADLLPPRARDVRGRRAAATLSVLRASSKPPQGVAKFKQPGAHSGFDGAQRNSRLGRDFGLGKIREVREFEEFAFTRLQFGYCGFDDACPLRAFEVAQSIRRWWWLRLGVGRRTAPAHWAEPIG